MTPQHRIILGAPRPGMPAREAWRHWTERHGDAVVGLPHVVGYVQDRILAPWWERWGLVVCTESWFSSREGEAEAFGSDHYRDVVGPDEARFMDRDRAWTSVVSGTEVVRDGPRSRFRVMAFGVAAEHVPVEGRVEVLHLRREPPGPGGEPSMLSAWTDDEIAASTLAEGLGGLSFVAEPATIAMPPGW